MGKTRGGWGEREGGVSHYFPPPPLTQIARILFLLGLFRGVPIIWGPGTGYVLETVLHTTGVSLIRCGSLTSSAAVPFLVSPNGCRELNYRLWLLLRTWNFYIRLMLVSFSAFCLSYCRVVESVGEVVSTILGRMKLSRANRSLWALLKQINRIEESFLSLLVFQVEINEKATRQLFVINSGKFNFDFSWEVHNRTKLKGLRCPEGEKLVSVTPETGTVPCSTRKRCQLAFCPPGRLSLSGCDLLLKVILSVNTTLLWSCFCL